MAARLFPPWLLKACVALTAFGAALCVAWGAMASVGLASITPLQQLGIPLVAGALVFATFALIAQLLASQALSVSDPMKEAAANDGPLQPPVPLPRGGPSRRPHLQVVR